MKALLFCFLSYLNDANGGAYMVAMMVILLPGVWLIALAAALGDRMERKGRRRGRDRKSASDGLLI